MTQLQTIQGTIADISRPLGPRGNWYIATIMPGQMKVTGVMPPVSIGDFCEFTGKTKTHPKFGEQFNADSCRVSYPRTETGIRRYFEMKCPGIGPAICERLFTWLRSCGKQAGDIWEVLRDTPDSLKEVKGISEKKLTEIVQWFAENESRRENDLFFVQNGISQNLISKIRDTYNLKTDAEVISLIKENPYRLADDVHGIGFKKADKIAMSIGIPKDNPFRIEAGLAWTLSEFAQEGHVFAPENEFSAKACSLLDVGIDAVKKATANARNNLRIIIDGKAVYLPELHRAEKVTARRLKELVRAARTVLPEGLTAEDLAQLDPDQIAALDSVCKNGVSIVTGGPGVGKTFLLRKILETLGAKLRVKLAAPTGKAAKRMSESTGHAASTIHRLLEYSRSKGEFTRNEENPIEADLVAIDETSMLDISLAADLLAAIPDGCRIIFIGDRNQLPSVGPGTVLADMIASGKIPVAELKTLHRQDAGSAIDMAARDMNAAVVMPFDRTKPVSMPYGGNNFVYHRVEKAEDIPAVIKCYIQKITGKTEYRLDDIQVLAPQKNTVIGVEKLNACLRDSIYNPDGKPIGNTGFRIGDKVMQIKNNYDLEVFNGEIGWIKEVTEIKTAEKDGRERTVSVAMIDFGDGEIPYPISLFEDELRVAYCFTIHKSQGSEFPVVIMPVHTTHTFMINRELIYTGITRGKSHVILIGNDKAIARAATIPSGKTRHSGLAERMG